MTGLAANPLRDAPWFVDEFDALRFELIPDPIRFGVILVGFGCDSGIDRGLNFILVCGVITRARGLGVGFAAKAENGSEITQ